MSKPKETPQTYYPYEWVKLTDAFVQVMARVGLRDLTRFCFIRHLRSGELGSMKISPDGTMTLLNPSDWQQRTVEAPMHPQEGVRVEPSVDGQVYVRLVDLDRLYLRAGTPTLSTPHPSDHTRPPERRRGPILKHEWHAIDGEIARRCINPQTRFLEIPKSERKLAKDMLGWCREKYDKEPAESGMRQAVKAICAALRVAYK